MTDVSYQIVPASIAESDMKGYSFLLSDVFQRPGLFTKDYLHWQYALNPVGSIVGYNALAGQTLAAHYVAQPILSKLNGEVSKGLLSLNTATHPAHQGKGLFVKLAGQTYEYAAANGYNFVIGVANQNSVNGFVKKLGFNLLGPLEALLGFGNLPIADDTSQFRYSDYWTDEILKWRLANPNRLYGISINHQIQITSATAYPFIRATLATFPATQFSLSQQSAGFGLLKLWIGSKAALKRKGCYFNIPAKFRPAPLYLIYKDLSGQVQKLNYDEVFFQALDFDAY